jgi:hypothetical protein
MVILDTLVPKDQLVHRVSPVLKVLLELKEQLDTLVPKVILDTLDLHLQLPVLLDILVAKEIQDLKEQDLLVLKVSQVRKDQ